MASDPTNWKAVKGDARKKVAPLVNHYAKMAHPFTACVADNTKRFGPDRAKRICAVVKDMGRRSTKWRNNEGEFTDQALDMLLEAAGWDVDGLELYLLRTIAEAELEEAGGEGTHRHRPRNHRLDAGVRRRRALDPTKVANTRKVLRAAPDEASLRRSRAGYSRLDNDEARAVVGLIDEELLRRSAGGTVSARSPR